MIYDYDEDMTQHMPASLRKFMEHDGGEPGFGKALLDGYRKALAERNSLPNKIAASVHRLRVTMHALAEGCDLLDELCGYEDRRDNYWVVNNLQLEGFVLVEKLDEKARLQAIESREMEIGVQFSDLLDTAVELKKDVAIALVMNGYASHSDTDNRQNSSEHARPEACAEQVRRRCDALAKHLDAARTSLLMRKIDAPRREHFPREELMEFCVTTLIPHLLFLTGELRDRIGTLAPYKGSDECVFGKVHTTHAAESSEIVDLAAFRNTQQRER